MEKERASKFLSAIERYSKEQQKILRAKFDDIKKNEFQIAEAEALRDAYYLIQDEMVKMRKSVDGSISRAELENKRVLINRRKEIKNDIFNKAKNALIKITKNESEYLKFLKSSLEKISQILNLSSTVIYVKPDDVKFSEQIKNFYGRNAEIEVDDRIEIGGVIAKNTRMALIVNETLDEKLKSQEVWFMRNSGLKVV